MGGADGSRYRDWKWTTEILYRESSPTDRWTAQSLQPKMERKQQTEPAKATLLVLNGRSPDYLFT